MQSVYDAVVEDNLAIYARLFNECNDENTIEYWKNARELYHNLDAAQQQVFFGILRTVVTDSVSTVFGVLDGVCALDGDRVFALCINGQGADHDLQDRFLAYVEDLEAERPDGCM